MRTYISGCPGSTTLANFAIDKEYRNLVLCPQNLKAVTRTILKEAARNKANFRNKLPDSIHLATALYSGCAIFVPNDANIRTPDNIAILDLSSLGEVL